MLDRASFISYFRKDRWTGWVRSGSHGWGTYFASYALPRALFVQFFWAFAGEAKRHAAVLIREGYSFGSPFPTFLVGGGGARDTTTAVSRPPSVGAII